MNYSIHRCFLLPLSNVQDVVQGERGGTVLLLTGKKGGCMTLERRDVDAQVTEPRTIEMVAGDLGLTKGEGKRFYCPGCQPACEGMPELVIKKGEFHCFRCGAEGDLVGLVKLARGCDLETAMVWLEMEAQRVRH